LLWLNEYEIHIIDDGQKVGGSEPLENKRPHDVKISTPVGEMKQLTLFDFLN
jgi:hypothetical protein